MDATRLSRVRVTETGEGGLEQEIVAGRHRLTVDEPKSLGGTDAGPTPYDLIAGALGACTAMTIRLYARRKTLPLTRVIVDLVHDKVHASDCEACETKDARIDRIQRTITLEGDLDDAARASLLAIAEKCPVHRTLQGGIVIETQLAE